MKYKSSKKEGFKKVVIIFIVLSLVGAVSIFSMMNRVQKTGEKSIIDIDDMNKKNEVIVVFGAGVREDGIPTEMLRDRLDKSIEIYNNNKDCKMLLSGDHGKKDYDEVGSMKKYILDNCNIDEKNLFLDHAGFCTYDTVYRAKYIFKIDKAVFVSNEYHLARALYLGKKIGIDVVGISSDTRDYRGMDVYKTREKLAQVKDFIAVNILKSEPKYLGDTIPVASSDGKITDDKL